jgi:hypothetical protein
MIGALVAVVAVLSLLLVALVALHGRERGQLLEHLRQAHNLLATNSASEAVAVERAQKSPAVRPAEQTRRAAPQFPYTGE